MILNPQELRRLRRVLTMLDAAAASMPLAAAGDRALIVKLGSMLKALRAPKRESDRKPALLAEYQGRPTPINGLAPDDLLEAFDAEAEGLGSGRGAMLREIMAKFINERIKFRRNARAALSNIVVDLERNKPELEATLNRLTKGGR